MTISEVTVIEIIDETKSLSFVELTNCVGLERRQLIEMVEAGLLEPAGAATEQWRFMSRDLGRLRSAQRLIKDLGVNSAGAAIILDLIEERNQLLKKLRLFEDSAR